MSIPETFPGTDLRCIRCGKTISLPTVEQRETIAVDPRAERDASTPVTEPVTQYTRQTDGWESFRCTCGRTVQLSPAFSAPHVRCGNCGRQIEVL